MDEVFHACRLFNVCGAIDGYHISLSSQKPYKWVIAIPTNEIVNKKNLQF
jgi:hypothetical protein